MTSDLKGKAVLITGASTGIGAAAAKAFGRLGSRVAIHYNSSRAAAEQVAADVRSSGTQAVLVGGDLSKPSNASGVVAETLAAFGRIDVLINNAGGLVKRTRIEDYSEEFLEGVIALNVIQVALFMREVIPIMQELGNDEEEQALTLGARGWQILFRVTLPKVRWGILYGAILCNARAMGEFGAVSVVSGHVRGQTNTLPLHVEVLYGEYQFSSAFAVASLLVLLAVATLVFMRLLGRRAGEDRA